MLLIISLWLVVAAWVIIPIWLGILDGNRYYRRRKIAFDWGTWGTSLGVGIPMSLIAAFILTLLFSGLGYIGSEVRSERSETPLEALNSQSATEGRFFLGSGYIDNEQVFSYIARNADNGYVLDNVDADQSVVYERPDQEPKMVTVRSWIEANQFISPFVFLTNRATTYEFYVPVGSVVTNSYEVAP